MLGTTFKDTDGILPDYPINIPVTDIHLGIISDVPVPLFSGAKMGGKFTDEIGINYHPLEVGDYQFHRGALIDTAFIPRNYS